MVLAARPNPRLNSILLRNSESTRIENETKETKKQELLKQLLLPSGVTNALIEDCFAFSD